MSLTLVVLLVLLSSATSSDVVTDTYYTDPLTLKNGHMIYTQMENTPVTMPTGSYALTGFFGEIVDAENNVSVPLSTLYTHHWIFQNDVHENKLCPDGPNYVFGIGAESRLSPVEFPDGWGLHVSGKPYWGANLHLLHTEGLAGDNPHKAAKMCNECYYAPTKGDECTPKRNGTFQCCGETDYRGTVGTCPLASEEKETSSATSDTFSLRYRLNYTRDVKNTKNLEIGVITTPKCSTYYEVLRNDDEPEHLSSTEFVVPQDMTIRSAIGHQHTGALNISLFLNDKFLCASFPTYGTEEGVAGNEKGYLVKMSRCVDDATTGPVPMKKGDRVRLDAYYYVGSDDPRLAYSDGTHLNVMAYMYTAYSIDGDASAAGERHLLLA
eukprot:g4117.t1